MEELLEVELLKVANKEKTVQVLGERTVSGLSVQLELIPFDSMCLYVVNFSVFSIVQSCLFYHCQGFETGNRGSKRRNRKCPA